MAGADIIGTAVCILLLVIVCYVVAGSVITISGVIINAQNDMTKRQQERMDTSIAMADYRYTLESANLWRINFTVLNNGNQVINNENQTDVVVTIGSNPPLYYENGLNTGAAACITKTWYYDGYFENDVFKANETLNPGQWDPNEYLLGQVWIGVDPSATSTQVQVIIPNGMTATNNKAIAAG
jgi:hypothetical protein